MFRRDEQLAKFRRFEYSTLRERIFEPPSDLFYRNLVLKIFGENRKEPTNSGLKSQESFECEKLVPHPNYDSMSGELAAPYDIAVIKLTTRVSGLDKKGLQDVTKYF